MFPSSSYKRKVKCSHVWWKPSRHVLCQCTCLEELVDFVQDLVIPAMRPPVLLQSPIVGTPTRVRDKLLYFRGDIRNHQSNYSRGIRQTLHTLAADNAWLEKHNIVIEDRWSFFHKEHQLDLYADHHTSSIFCLVVPGERWSKVTCPLRCSGFFAHSRVCIDILQAYIWLCPWRSLSSSQCEFWS